MLVVGAILLAAFGRSLALSVAESGFTRGMMRGFARGRRQVGIAADAPYRLTRLADGRFIMEDPGQTMRVELDVFGSANAAILARIWRAGDALDARSPG